MTLTELETVIVKINAREDLGVSSESVVSEIKKLQERINDGTITREEEVVYWMFLKACDRPAAERWTAIMRGETTPGKTDEGYID